MSSIFDQKVAVLYGGIGSEREVSLESGVAVLHALQSVGCKAFGVDITGCEEQIASLKCDIAFIALHGEFGEDGQIQRLLEKYDIAYVGSGVEASHLAIDKSSTKQKLADALLPTAAWITISKNDNPLEALKLNKIALPCVAKPNSKGSSVGVHIIHDVDDFDRALNDIFAIDKLAIIEKFISGRELTVSVLDGVALPVIEMEVRDGFYDYQAKYKDGRTVYHCPAGINSDIAELSKAIAVAACDTLGVRDMARVDFILGRHGLMILEVNTIPGFTSHSLLPKAAEANGITFGNLCLNLVEMAYNRKVVTPK